MKKPKYYTVAFESGSWSEFADPGLGCRYEAHGTCGHHHRTIETAERCKDKLRQKNDASWLSASVHDPDGHRANYEDWRIGAECGW